MVNGVGEIGSERLREQCKKKWARTFESKVVEWKEASDAEYM